MYTNILHFPILKYFIAQIKFTVRRSEVSNTSDEKGLRMCGINNYHALFLNLWKKNFAYMNQHFSFRMMIEVCAHYILVILSYVVDADNL